MKIHQLPLGPLQTNCYVLACEETNQATIIDPSDSGNEILGFLKENQWELAHVLLTHTHFDHIGGLAEIQTASPDTPVYAHPDAIPMLQFGAQSAMRFNIQMEQPADPTHTLSEPDTISVGNLLLEVLDTPGHAPGHVCFYLREHGVLFDGDVLFQGSIGRTDLPGGDYSVLMQSIEEKLLPLPDETHILSGHGPSTTLGKEKTTNPFLN